MVRTIRAMFPRNYDFPSDRHIKNRIKSLMGTAQRRREREAQIAQEIYVPSNAAVLGDGEPRPVMSTPSPLHQDSRSDESGERVMESGRDEEGVEREKDPEIEGVQQGEGERRRDVSNEEDCRMATTSLSLVRLPAVGGFIFPPGVSTTVDVTTDTDVISTEVGTPATMTAVHNGSTTPEDGIIGALGSVSSSLPERRTTKIKQGVPMCTTYANAILAILGEFPGIKRGDVYRKLLRKIHL